MHTNLKGKLKKVGRGKDARYEFIEDEKAISDDDLKALRKLSRELDSNASPYFCIVSVLMLREGWDVRNVTTIVPLRPYSSKANILPEQTLERGLHGLNHCYLDTKSQLFQALNQLLTVYQVNWWRTISGCFFDSISGERTRGDK